MIGSGMEFFHYRKLLPSAVERQDKDGYIVVRASKHREARLGAVAELHLPLEGVGHARLIICAFGRRRGAVGHAFLVRRCGRDAAQSHGGVARGVKRPDELGSGRRGLIGRLGGVTRRRLKVDALCRGGTLDVASRGHGSAAVAAVAAKEEQQHKESRDTTHVLEFTDRRRVVLGAGDALVHGMTAHFLGTLSAAARLVHLHRAASTASSLLWTSLKCDGTQTRYFCQKRQICQ